MKGENDKPIRPSRPADDKDEALFDSLAAAHVQAIWVAAPQAKPPAAPQVPQARPPAAPRPTPVAKEPPPPLRPAKPVEEPPPAAIPEEPEEIDPQLVEKLHAVARKWGIELPVGPEDEPEPLPESAAMAVDAFAAPAAPTEGRWLGLLAQAAMIALGAAASGLLAWRLLFR